MNKPLDIMMKQPWRMIAAVLMISVVSAIALRSWLHPPLKLTVAQLLPAPKPMQQDYVLTVGATKIHLNQLKDHWILLFFGYASCPDVCPLELQKLGQVLKHFDGASPSEKPWVVFVSVDPERDDPELLKKYASHFHSDLIAVTGTNAELAALAGFFGASYNRTATVAGKDYLVEPGADMPAALRDEYMVNHSSRIFILDREARYVGSFAPPHDSAALIVDIEQLLEH